MVDYTALLVPGIFLLVGLGFAYSARNSYRKSKTATELRTDGNNQNTTGDTTIRGPLEVEKPAELPDAPPQLETETPGLIVWRIQEKVSTRGQNRRRSRWRTKDGGIATGSATLRQNWEDVVLGLEEFDTTSEESMMGSDPFDHPNLFLDGPDQQFYLGELDPVSKRLEKWGLTADDGLLSNFEFTISLPGRQTMTPDRYEATVIEDGETVTASGVLEEDKERNVLRGTAEEPLIISATDLNERADTLRTKAYKEAAIGFVLVVLALGVGISMLM